MIHQTNHNLQKFILDDIVLHLGFDDLNSSCIPSWYSCIHISGLLRGLTLPLPIDVTCVKLVLSVAYGTFLWGDVVREYPK